MLGVLGTPWAMLHSAPRGSSASRWSEGRGGERSEQAFSGRSKHLLQISSPEVSLERLRQHQ